MILHFKKVGVVLKNNFNHFILTGTVFLEGDFVPNQFIKVEDGKITEIGNASNLPTDFSGNVYTYPENHYIVPGFIDIHIHGANSADTMDATNESLSKIASILVQEGTTSFLATTITQNIESIENALSVASSYIEEHQPKNAAEIIGIHLEGPFINAIHKGAQPENYIVQPDIQLFQKWQSIAKEHIKVVTLAPEVGHGFELVQYLNENGVIASIGHSDAKYEDVKLAIEHGAKHITHLFNGMRSIHHRDLGTAGSALLFDELNVEMIVDGHHIHPEMVRFVTKVKPLDQIILITDSMRAKWLADGVSELGGQKVIVENGTARLESGSLAGSILKMNEAIKNMMNFGQISLSEAIKLATYNPAKALGILDRKGIIAVGRDADIVVLNEDIEPILTITRGEFAYIKEVQ